MSHSTYWLMHIVALLALFMSFGITLLGTPQGSKPPRIASILHGIGLLVMLIAGMGMIARLHLDDASYYWPLWIWAKLGIWLLLAVLPIFARSGWIPRPVGWLVALGLAAMACWMVLNRPWV